MRTRTILGMILGLALVSLAFAASYFVAASHDHASAATVVGGLGAFLIGLAAGGPLIIRLIRGHTATTSEARLDLAIAAFEDKLAAEWTDEAQLRHLTNPVAIRLKWDWSTDRDHAVRPSDLEITSFTDRHQSEGASRPLPTSGGLDDLFDVYDRVATKKLVILGPAGAGKTAALIFLLTRALTRRRASSGSTLQPVPFLVAISDWNPHVCSLRDWAAITLARDHSYLRADAYGRDAPQELLRNGRIALFLDGLDEMQPEFVARAISRIGLADGFRVVLTSRVSQFNLAVEQEGFANAAVVRMRPVDVHEARAYLTRGQTANRGAWEDVATALASFTRPELNAVLSIPLYLNLARAQYKNQVRTNPLELLDERQFPTEDSLKRHLLEGVITRAEERPRLRDVRRRLAWVATEMSAQESRILPWWRVRQWLPSTSVLASCVLFSAAAFFANLILANLFTALIWFVSVLLLMTPISLMFVHPRAITADYSRGFRRRSAFALTLGSSALGVGLLMQVAQGKFRGLDALPPSIVFGLIGGVGVRVMRYRDRPLRVSLGWPRRTDLYLGLVAGCAGGGITAILAISVVATGLALGAGFAVFGAGTVGLSLISRITRPDDSPTERSSPLESYRSDRTGGLVFALIGGTAIGVAVAVPVGLVRGWIPGLASGLATGPLIAMAALLIVGQGVSLYVNALFDYYHRCPRHLVKYLEECRKADIIRQVGTLYQFSHADIQDHLANTPFQ